MDTKQSSSKRPRPRPPPPSKNSSSSFNRKKRSRLNHKRPRPPPPPSSSSTKESSVHSNHESTKNNETVMSGETQKRKVEKKKQQHSNVPRWKLNFKDLYRTIDLVGQGTYGSVFKGTSKETNRTVALKKIQMTNEQEGFPLTALREIKALMTLKHKNIVELIEVVISKPNDSNRNVGHVYMVFEYMEFDLSGLVDKGLCLTQSHVMCYAKQLLEAVAFMHKQGFIHRDIKGANLLINRKNVLKLADLGLARVHVNKRLKHKKPYTNRVVTLWYRPPELLLGETYYDSKIDLWGVGCLFAEWLYGDPILPGNNEIEQLKLIFNLCGTPNLEDWPDHVDKPKWESDAEGWCRANKKESTLETRFRRFSELELDLVKRMLSLNPEKRCSAVDALKHSYFRQTGLNQCLEPEEYVVKFSRKKWRSFIHIIFFSACVWKQTSTDCT